MKDEAFIKQIQETFLLSREGAIVRCASIMISSRRKDLAKQILDTAHINKTRFEEIRAKNI